MIGLIRALQQISEKPAVSILLNTRDVMGMVQYSTLLSDHFSELRQRYTLGYTSPPGRSVPAGASGDKAGDLMVRAQKGCSKITH
jgi:hypothetical protein